MIPKELFLIIFILKTSDHVLWQTVKTQMEMPNKAAFHKGPHCLQMYKQIFIIEMLHN